MRSTSHIEIKNSHACQLICVFSLALMLSYVGQQLGLGVLLLFAFQKTLLLQTQMMTFALKNNWSYKTLDLGDPHSEFLTFFSRQHEFDNLLPNVLLFAKIEKFQGARSKQRGFYCSPLPTITRANTPSTMQPDLIYIYGYNLESKQHPRVAETFQKSYFLFYVLVNSRAVMSSVQLLLEKIRKTNSKKWIVLHHNVLLPVNSKNRLYQMFIWWVIRHIILICSLYHVTVDSLILEQAHTKEKICKSGFFNK